MLNKKCIVFIGIVTLVDVIQAGRSKPFLQKQASSSSMGNGLFGVFRDFSAILSNEYENNEKFLFLKTINVRLNEQH